MEEWDAVLEVKYLCRNLLLEAIFKNIAVYPKNLHSIRVIRD
jgi:hypothetical protein